jgi:hypothetical protein
VSGPGGAGAGGGEQPDALELLAIARETLLEELLPRLEGEARYQALMIASALAMAGRELAAGDGAERASLEHLRGLYEHDRPPEGEGTREAMARLEARLAKDLRDGVLDGGPQYAVRRWLRARIEARLAVSNPKRLAPRGGKSGGDAS